MTTLTVSIIALGLAAATATVGQAAGSKASIQFKNSYFYDAGGKFLPEKAKDAYVAVMKYHGYPVFPDIREKLWVSDYGTGQFAKLGLGAVMFVNNTTDHYMLMDLYLLPNQMMPEHWHEEGGKGAVKLEGWVVRHGLAHIVGEGEPNLGKDVVIPECHEHGTVTVKHEVVCGPGDVAQVNDKAINDNFLKK